MIFDQSTLPPAAKAALASRFEDVTGKDWPRGTLDDMVASGVFQFVVVGEREPQYAIWFHKQADLMFHCNAALSLSKNRMAQGLNLLDSAAKNFGCRGVVFETKHPGLVRQSQKQGYRQTAVVMEKVF